MIELPIGDTIIATRRKHWLMLALPLVPLVLLAPIPFILYVWLAGNTFDFGSRTITFPLAPAVIYFAGSVWLLILWMRAGHIFTDYYLDVWTLTDKHLVGTDQRTLFHRHSAIVRIERIQDIAVEINGLVETFFEFGDIHVQSAGESREFVMRGVDNPHTFREMVLREQDTLLRQQTSAASDTEPNISSEAPRA